MHINNIFLKSITFILVIVLVSCSREEATTPKLTVEKYYCFGDISQCEQTTPFGQLSVQINMQDIVEENPFRIKLEGLESIQKLSVSSYIEGVEMFMGKIPVFFKRDDSSNLIAETMMVGCTEDEMKWRLWIEIADKQTKESVRLFIDFSVFRN